MTFSIRASASLVLILAIGVAARAADDEQGFVSLFDGEAAKGWEQGVVIKDGVATGGGRYVAKQHGDFVLRFEFRLQPGGNSGIGLRADRTGDAAYHGMESQVLDNTHPMYAKLQPYQYHGSIYGVLAAKRGHLKPTGEWNTQEITADGDHIKIVLNGTTIVDANIREAAKDGTIDGRDHPGLFKKTGHLGILGHGPGVEFRNMRVKELP